ncbi:MAG: 4-hydroxybenzoate octaprenyltransferase [Pseudomonadota bacterium]
MTSTHRAQMPTPGSPAPPDSEYPWWVKNAPTWAQPYMLLARLDRPIGTWLLLLPCWWGAALGAMAEGEALPSLWHLTLFAIGALVMRSAGCAFNDIVDKDLDAHVARTRSRPVASGQLSRSQALALSVGLSLIGLVILLQFNTFTLWLGIASVGLVAAYPFMKRITFWPQAWLGLAFNYGALVGYSAATGELAVPALLLYGAGIAWTLGYDTIYACQDVEDDALVGVKSTARLFGAQAPLWVGRFFALQSLLLLAAVLGEGAPVLISAISISCIALYLATQSAALRQPNPDYLALFRQHRGVGVIVFAIICIINFL